MKFLLVLVISLLALTSTSLTNSQESVNTTNDFTLGEIDGRAVEILDYSPSNNQIEEMLNRSKGIIVLSENDNIETPSSQKNMIQGYEAASYYYKNHNDETVKGTVLSDNRNTGFEKSIYRLINDLNDQTYASHITPFDVGEGWTKLSEQKFDWSMYDGNIWYGDFSEWGCHYIYEEDGYRYHLQTRETYITPGNDTDPTKPGIETDDFRSSRLEYVMGKPEGTKSNFELRAYNPKMRYSSATTTDQVTGHIGTDGASLEASFSYTVTTKSPTILDYSNLVKNTVDILFKYLTPYDEGNYGENYNYNTLTSMQLMMNVWREKIITPDNEGDCVDTRRITLVRDSYWFWEDKTITFTYTINGRL